MADGVLISRKDLGRIGKMLRWFEHSRQSQLFRRRSIKGGIAITHIAYCKTDAPSDSSIITCHLDEDETGEEIDVNCELFAASALSECTPELKDGDPIKVIMIEDEWWCIDPDFNGYVECTE